MEPTVAEFSEPPVIRYHIRREASNDQSTGSQDCASRIAYYGSASEPVTEMEINHAVDMPHSPYSRPLASSLTLDSLWNEKKKKGEATGDSVEADQGSFLHGLCSGGCCGRVE